MSDTTQAIATETPVINFAEKTASRPPRKRVGKRPNHPDADLIEYCIEYGMQIAAGKAAFPIDPTNATFAAYFDNLTQSRADRALVSVLDMDPVTLDGLRAKASLVEVAMSDWDAFDSIMIDELRKKFLISLANDINRFQRSAMDQQTSHISFLEPRG
jgi:hypothetical protein